MKKRTKRIIAFSMAVLLGLDLLPSNVNTAQAAKKVSVSISKSKISASKKVTLSVKNLPKKAKVTVSSSKVKCISFAKKKAVKKKTWEVKNGGTKKITVYAKKKGNATLTVVVKNRKGKKLLTKVIGMKVTKLVTKEDQDTEVIDLSKSTPSAEAVTTDTPEASKTPATADTEKTPKPAEITQETPQIASAQPGATASAKAATQEPKKTASPGGGGGGGSSSGGSSSSGNGNDSGNNNSNSGNSSGYVPWTPSSGGQTNQAKDFSLTAEKTNLFPGEDTEVTVKFGSTTNRTSDLVWTSDKDGVAVVVSQDGKVHALTPGTAKITAKMKGTSFTHSFTVTVKESEVKWTVENITDLTTKLTESQSAVNADKKVLLTYQTQETDITIPAGNYSNVTLVVKAPEATITNSALFKQVVVEQLKKDTWVECSGNHLYFNAENSHVIFKGTDTPCLTVLGGADSVTVENNGNLQELLIASAAKIVVKGNDIAKKVKVYDYAELTTITTYVPLNITSTQKFVLQVGAGGEQTAVAVSSEKELPKIEGVGVIDVKIQDGGTTKSVVAETADNQTDLVSQKKINVSGRILPETEGGTVTAEVYLVPFTVETTGNNISISLNKADTLKKEVKEGDKGNYSFSDVLVGNYTLVVKATGYELITQMLYLTSGDYTVEEIQLLKTSGKPGKIEGVVKDAAVQDGGALAERLTVILRKGMNNITGEKVQEIQITNGTFTFNKVTPGQYTVQVVDSGDFYAYQSVAVFENATVSVELAISRNLNVDSLRFILNWGDGKNGESKDLDLHVYAPYPYCGYESGVENHIYLNNKVSYGYSYETGDYVNTYEGGLESLDVDDKNFSGPETVTIHHIEKGLYKIYVQDWSGEAKNSLYRSKPQIKVYAGNSLVKTVNMPQADGNVWYVGNYNSVTGQFEPVNEMTNKSSSEAMNKSLKAQIGTVFNQLAQFTVTDKEQFRGQQAVLDEVAEKYCKESDESVLQTYLTSVKNVLSAVESALTLTSLKYDGGAESWGDEKNYRKEHGFYLYSAAETLEPGKFQPVFKEGAEGDVTSVKKTMNENGWSYVLELNSTTLGVSTKYYFNKCNLQITWVKSIEAADELWQSNVRKNWCSGNGYSYYDSAYVGGSSADIPKDNVNIRLGTTIEETSREYKSDFQATEERPSWEYGEDVDLVLHLKDTSTGLTCDYKVRYIPLGADLLGIKVSENVILEQVVKDGSIFSVGDNDKRWYDWYSGSGSERNFYVLGENKTLSDDFVPVVRDGFTAEKDEADKFKVTVTGTTNGAKVVYHIKYYQSARDCEILGVTDSENVFSSIKVQRNYGVKGNKPVGVISLTGRNSELGKNLTIHTAGATVKNIEYDVTGDSFENYNDAHVVLRSQTGEEFDYYISYQKMDGSTKIKSVTAAAGNNNTIYKVHNNDNSWHSNNGIAITGSGTEVGQLQCITEEGYTAEQDGDCLKVKDGSGNVVESHYIYYSREVGALKPLSIGSASDKTLKMSGSTEAYLAGDSRATDGFAGEVKVTGYQNTLVVDGLTAVAGYGTTATFETVDGQDYPAKLTVTKGEKSVKFKVFYTPDDSGAKLVDIVNTQNEYVEVYASESKNYRYKKGNGFGYEDVYICKVLGKNQTLGTNLSFITCGSPGEVKFYSDDNEWPYGSGSGDSLTCNGVSYPVKDAARVEITAANGTKRIYVIMYGKYPEE